MFHGICPECGREIAPTMRECPVCDPVAATVGTALAGEVEAPARAWNEGTQPSAALPRPLAAPDTQPSPNLAASVEPVSPRPAWSSSRAAETETPDTLPQFGEPGTGDPLECLSQHMFEFANPEPRPATQMLQIGM